MIRDTIHKLRAEMEKLRTGKPCRINKQDLRKLEEDDRQVYTSKISSCHAGYGPYIHIANKYAHLRTLLENQ